MIRITLSGDANKHKGSKSGIYYMQPGFSNGQRYWISSEGNAIWYSTDVDWSIGSSESPMFQSIPDEYKIAFPSDDNQ